MSMGDEMASQSLEPVEVEDTTTLQAIYKLRAEVWMGEGISAEIFPFGVWQDDCDKHAKHWVVFNKGQVIASARLSVHQSLKDVPNSKLYEGLSIKTLIPIASINRLVVRRDFRGIGLGKKLDLIRLYTASQLGCHTVVAYCVKASGEERIRSLKRRGFKIISPDNYYHLEPWGNVTAFVLYTTRI